MSSQDVPDAIRALVGGVRRADAVVVFGYGPVLPGSRPGMGRLNAYGRLTTLAAGMVCAAVETPLIVPTGGRTGRNALPTEAALIARLMIARFAIPRERFALEEEAFSTLQNVVLVANLLDQRAGARDTVLLVAMGYHLARIQTICALVGLEGLLVPAEAVMSLRSERHRRVVSDLVAPSNSLHATLASDSRRFLWGLNHCPNYWLPDMALVENPQRLRRIVDPAPIRAHLLAYGVNVDALTPDELRSALRTLPQETPDAFPRDAAARSKGANVDPEYRLS